MNMDKIHCRIKKNPSAILINNYCVTSMRSLISLEIKSYVSIATARPDHL